MEIETCSNRDEIIALLAKYGVGFRTLDDPLFTKTDIRTFEQPAKKLGIYSAFAEEDLHIKNEVSCNVPNCHKQFDTIFGYESHYNSCHRHVCSECHKNLPSAHLLDLHLSEKHDSFFAVQSQTKPMFACLIDDCTVICITPEDRKDHCINVHQYPHNFRFDFMPKKKSHNQSRGVSESKDLMDEGEDIVEDSPMENTTQNEESTSTSTITTSTTAPQVERTQTLLKTINFGHSQPKSFNMESNYAKVLTKNQPKAKSKTKILDDNEMVVDLISSLPE